MNCFQFDYFCGYHTAQVALIGVKLLLWIAFNLITFVDITQQEVKIPPPSDCCELLSIWLLLWISHSLNQSMKKIILVVNCFQFDYFCGYHTAQLNTRAYTPRLWIAFNLITFVDITQLAWRTSSSTKSCELLSIWLLLWISHSTNWLNSFNKEVVNCFQFDYFCWYHTAFRPISNQ